MNYWICNLKTVSLFSALNVDVMWFCDVIVCRRDWTGPVWGYDFFIAQFKGKVIALRKLMVENT